MYLESTKTSQSYITVDKNTKVIQNAILTEYITQKVIFSSCEHFSPLLFYSCYLNCHMKQNF